MAEKNPDFTKEENKQLKPRSTSVFDLEPLMQKQNNFLTRRARSMTIGRGEEQFSLTDEINSIRSYIKCKFQHLKGKINHLEDKMMDSLDNIERKYSEKQKQRVVALSKISHLKDQIDDLLKENSLQVRINATIDEKYMPATNKSEVCISLHWPDNIDASFHQIENALKITEHDAKSMNPPSNESLIKLPSVHSFGRLGQGLGEMVSPRSITMSEDGNVYCSDWENNTILSFTQFGEYIHAIKDVKHPYSVYAHNDRLFVTESNNSFLKVGKVGNHACIKAFDLNGNLLKKMGKWGTSPGNFKTPSGITACEMEDRRDEVFVCDTDNNRLQILSVNLEFIKVFVPGKVKQPDDVKVQGGHVYILDKSDPCLHIFTFLEEPIAHIISRGPGRDIESSFFFTLDKSGSIIIGDHERHCLRVFTPSGKLARSIGKPDVKSGDFCYPLGIAHNQDEVLAVVSLRQTGCIRLFNLNLNVFSF